MENNITGYFGNLTENELICLDRVKDHVKNDLKINDEKFYDDYHLLRFCRARKFKYEDIVKMFDNFIEWRKENDIEEIPKLDFPDNEKIEEQIQHGYIGIDKLGRPIYIEKIGNVDAKKLFSLFNDDEIFMSKYYIQGYERLLKFILPTCSKLKGEVVETTLTIIDLKGWGITKVFQEKTRKLLKLILGMSQDRYPETLGNLFIINSPMMFSVIWSFIKPFLDKKTISKIKVLGSKYKKELFNLIDEEQLPECYGGKFNKKYYENHGPWKNLIDESIKQKTFNLD